MTGLPVWPPGFGASLRGNPHHNAVMRVSALLSPPSSGTRPARILLHLALPATMWGEGPAIFLQFKKGAPGLLRRSSG